MNSVYLVICAESKKKNRRRIFYTKLALCIRISLKINYIVLTALHEIGIYICIRESVDSLCRDETDAPIM